MGNSVCDNIQKEPGISCTKTQEILSIIMKA